MDWDKLIEERNEWVAKNFEPGNYFPSTEVQIDTVLGCVEEVGELAHSHIKESQEIRGTQQEHEAAAKDAIGDLTVYLLGVMRHVGAPKIRQIYSSISSEKTLLALANAVGTLCIRQSRYDVEKIVDLCRLYCDHKGWDYERIVQETWDHVKKRDWKAKPQDGVTA